MQTSLDGYVEGPDGNLDWIISGDEEWTEMFKDLEHVDTFLLGSKMYSGYAGYWRSLLGKSATTNQARFAQLADRTPHIVFSTTMATADWANTTIARDAATEIPKLKQVHGKTMVAWGGGAFAASLMALGLVDEYRITVNPTILGDGKPLFPKGLSPEKIVFSDARPLKSGNIVLRYRTAR